MKRGLSIKLKLTLWFTCFMALIAAVCLGLVLIGSDRVERNETIAILSLVVRSNIEKVSLSDGKLAISPDFQFYANDVYMLIYNKNKALLSGQVPPSFPVNTALENGVTKFVPGEENGFYVLDFWVPAGWSDGVWLRGVLHGHDSRRTMGSIFTMSSILLPFIILSAALGGYLIAKRTLDPISNITKAAGSISEGKDLTRRIGLPPGRDEISLLASAFDRMFERLEHSFEAEKQFTSDASHELRTPTTVILAQCGYAKKHAASVQDYQEALEVIERQARRMSELIERLLDMTRLELGTRKLRPEILHLSEMVKILCEEQDTGRRGILILTEVQEEIYVKGDSLLLSGAIENLLDNARKYGKEGGHIIVRLYTVNNDSPALSTAVLEVEDDGIGMEASELDKIWQRFYQVNAARQSDAGLGLGLSMVRQIMHLHGGEAQVRSVPGVGSCFKLTLSSIGKGPA